MHSRQALTNEVHIIGIILKDLASHFGETLILFAIANQIDPSIRLIRSLSMTRPILLIKVWVVLERCFLNKTQLQIYL